MKKIVSLIIFFAIVVMTNIYSQIEVTSYSIYALGINTSKEKKISGELKSFFNRDIDNTLFELSGMYNFRQKEYYQFSVGAGINLMPFLGYDPINCFTFPVQLQLFPLQNLKQLSFVIELSPELYPEDGASIRHLWGIRYTFNRSRASR